MAPDGVTLAPFTSSSLSQSLLKIIEVVEEENAVLQEHRIVFHSGFTDRKNQALRELMAVQRSERSRDAAVACRSLLKRLSDALRTNSSLLKLHIAAVGEVSDIIIGSLREADSDGTYSRHRNSRA
jgi:hypothetical protein